jgi:hypothetical protein
MCYFLGRREECGGATAGWMLGDAWWAEAEPQLIISVLVRRPTFVLAGRDYGPFTQRVCMESGDGMLTRGQWRARVGVCPTVPCTTRSELSEMGERERAHARENERRQMWGLLCWKRATCEGIMRPPAPRQPRAARRRRERSTHGRRASEWRARGDERTRAT